jgi:DNA polymerase-3 subunit epsilon
VIEPGLSRTQAAARLLAAGPSHTMDLAREVLGLRGAPGAAAAAVFALLGSDPRFAVDGQGIWTLEDGAEVGPPLESLKYAVVDVETTGGSMARGHRITEVGVVIIEDGAISDSFESLVNPLRRIPSFVSRLTGISDGMVAESPTFDEIAEPLSRVLQGSVFVAHNASFDWAFVQGELVKATGDELRMERLCTVKLARRLVPELRRRNLDSLSQHFDVMIEGRHRAYGDALATAQVFLRLMDLARDRGIRDLAGLARLVDGRNRPRRRLTAETDDAKEDQRR